MLLLQLLLLPLLLGGLPLQAAAQGVPAQSLDPAAARRANEQLAALNALPAALGSPVLQSPAPEAQRITIEEQLQQAEALGVALTQEQLARANPLLGTAGRLADPQRTSPNDWPDG
jgi:hypothetical protein